MDFNRLAMPWQMGRISPTCIAWIHPKIMGPQFIYQQETQVRVLLKEIE